KHPLNFIGYSYFRVENELSLNLANGIYETPAGGKAQVRPRSAKARGGSTAACGKRVYSMSGVFIRFRFPHLFPNIHFIYMIFLTGVNSIFASSNASTIAFANVGAPGVSA